MRWAEWSNFAITFLYFKLALANLTGCLHGRLQRAILQSRNFEFQISNAAVQKISLHVVLG
jgi:hypothetical protein